jgi:hypothetical protein
LLVCPAEPAQALRFAASSERFEFRWVSLLGTNAGFPETICGDPRRLGPSTGTGTGER